MIRLFGWCATLLFFGCQQAAPQHGFYHWKSIWNAEPELLQELNHPQVDALYFRLADFDIDLNKHQPKRVSHLVLVDSLPHSEVLIPVIYLTNRLWQSIDSTQIETLAQAVVSLAENTLNSYNWNELQLDSDWSVTTQEPYFQFLASLRKMLPKKQLSCTIRLHQYADPEKTGVPPVDRGVLMLYNTGGVTNLEESNSILNLKVVESYLRKAQRYPLHIDVAVPIFSWAVVYRDGLLWRLFYPITTEELTDQPHITAFAEHQFQVNRNTHFRGNYLNKGDFIRYESIEPQQLVYLRKLIEKYAPNLPEGRWIYYHLSAETQRVHPIDSLLLIF